MEVAMSQSERPSDASRNWLTGIIVIVATIISYVGFARVSVGWTLIVASLVLMGLVIFLWSVGRKKRTGGQRR